VHRLSDIETLNLVLKPPHGVELLRLGRGFGPDGDGGFAYFDTQSRLGVLVEAVELPARRCEPELVIHSIPSRSSSAAASTVEGGWTEHAE
jgi:hypothetical protein